MQPFSSKYLEAVLLHNDRISFTLWKILTHSISRTIQAISALQVAVPRHLEPHEKPQQHFLMTFQESFVRYCQHYAKKPDDERRPMMLTVEGIEFASGKLAGIDTSRFLLPVSLLQAPNNAVSNISSMTESPILPLLRCLGVPNTLRLLSALLSDRRILLVSTSPTRLTNCARSALSILAQGQLQWQHLFIPVLPPHLFQYLQAPMPYLVGMLASNMSKLNYMQELGEMLLINLDQNALETRGIPTNLVAARIPDLCKGGEIDPNSNACEFQQVLVLVDYNINLYSIVVSCRVVSDRCGNVRGRLLDSRFAGTHKGR
jgi:hypothetical protein